MKVLAAISIGLAIGLTSLLFSDEPKTKSDQSGNISLTLNLSPEELINLLRKSGVEVYSLEEARKKLTERDPEVKLYSLQEARDILLDESIKNALHTVTVDELVRQIRKCGAAVYTKAELQEAIESGKMPKAYVTPPKLTPNQVKNALEEALGIPVYFTREERDRAAAAAAKEKNK